MFLKTIAVVLYVFILQGCGAYLKQPCRPAYAVSDHYDPTSALWQMQEQERMRCMKFDTPRQ